MSKRSLECLEKYNERKRLREKQRTTLKNDAPESPNTTPEREAYYRELKARSASSMAKARAMMSIPESPTEHSQTDERPKKGER